MPTILDDIGPNSFYQEFSEDIYDRSEDVSFTAEDMQEVEIFNCPLCGDHFDTKIYKLCDYHYNELLKKI